MSAEQYDLNITRLECKDIPKRYFYRLNLNLNITRLECKVDPQQITDATNYDLNITRLECKENYSEFIRDWTDIFEYNQIGM